MNFHFPDYASTDMLIVAMIVGALVLPAYLIGRWSQSRGNSFWTGFLMSLFATPTVGALVVGFTAPRTKMPSIQ